MTTTRPGGPAPAEPWPADRVRADPVPDASVPDASVAADSVGADSVRADEASVLADLTVMIEQVLGEYGLDDTEIGMDTRFGRDLELESIDLVTLAGLLEDRYGRLVNFAEFVASMELEEIIELSVGRLVEYVCLCLKAAGRD